jgi:hypothetical protein
MVLVALVETAVRQIMGTPQAMAPPIMAVVVVVGLAGIARLVETAGQTIVLAQQLPELLAAMALAGVLAEEVVALGNSQARNIKRDMVLTVQDMAEVLV